jgi:molybdate transport system substrate-binding protein
VLIDPRLDIVGPFPTEVQREVVYAAGVAADSNEAETAKAFVAYLMSPSAIAVIKARGMNPAAPVDGRSRGNRTFHERR